MKDSETVKIYLNQLYEIPSLSEEEEKELFYQIKKKGRKAEKARLRIIESNLPLVVSLAKKYYYPSMNIDFLNFIEEGNIGLMRAVEKFDVSKGFKFSTYASWWIEKHFQGAVLRSRSVIQMPEKTWISLKKVEATINELLHETGHTPDIKELSNKIDLSMNEIRDILNSATKVKNVKSLDYYLDNDETRTLGDTISNEEFTLDMVFNKINEGKDLKNLLSVLTPQEQEVIELRFGVVDGNRYTYKEIGEKMKISPLKAKDLQEIAIRKLKRLSDE
ncbi:MAG: sigma-70 family RNA polymerase sigma factor [Elusimicrobia bacterium]|nr:sigma-70 family RNA polymerase sigma factor [Elusimicrobiota bacterium]